MNNKFLLVSLALLSPGLVFAQAVTSFACSYDGMQRRIVILTEPGVTVPCQVQYYKDTEMPGEVQTLWTADSDASYCESKASEFAAKLESWGWSCAAGEPAAEAESGPKMKMVPAPEPDPKRVPGPDTELAVDDTEALEPAE
ncbi:MAG: hypothetical protein ACR2QL_06915 [Woeseiaceae bacterium]